MWNGSRGADVHLEDLDVTSGFELQSETLTAKKGM
jgi:hypothetical protein